MSIVNEIREKYPSDRYEEAIHNYGLKPQQISRCRGYLGILKNHRGSNADRAERNDNDLALAIERAKRRAPKRPKKVTYFGKEYWDVTELFIDCGD